MIGHRKRKRKGEEHDQKISKKLPGFASFSSLSSRAGRKRVREREWYTEINKEKEKQL